MLDIQQWFKMKKGIKKGLMMVNSSWMFISLDCTVISNYTLQRMIIRLFVLVLERLGSIWYNFRTITFFVVIKSSSQVKRLKVEWSFYCFFWYGLVITVTKMTSPHGTANKIGFYFFLLFLVCTCGLWTTDQQRENTPLSMPPGL